METGKPATPGASESATDRARANEFSAVVRLAAKRRRELDKQWKQDHHQYHGKNENAQRDRHFDGELVGALLGPQQPAVTHFITEDA